MEATQTLTTNTNPADWKRSAKKVHETAVENGWELHSADVTHGVLHVKYTRDDAEQQTRIRENMRVRRQRPLMEFKASFDAESGGWAYWGGTFYDHEGCFHTGPESVTEAVELLMQPRTLEQRELEQQQHEDAEAIKEARRDAFVAEARTLSEDDWAGRSAVKRLGEWEHYVPQPIEADMRYGTDSVERFIRNAHQEAVHLIAQQLAQKALLRWGHPKRWDDEGMPQDAITLQEAVTMVCDDALRSYGYDSVLAELKAAVRLVDKGY